MEEGWKNLREAFKQSWNKAFRYGCYLVLIEFVLFGIGIGIWLILHGLWLMASRLVLYLSPVRKWFITKIIKTEDERYLQTPPLNLIRVIYAISYLGAGAIMIFVGVKIIAQNGFLGQNLIYMLLSQ